VRHLLICLTFIAGIYQCSINSESKSVCLFSMEDEPFSAVFSIILSNDNKEILCGANDNCIYIYDRMYDKVIMQVCKIITSKNKKTAICLNFLFVVFVEFYRNTVTCWIYVHWHTLTTVARSFLVAAKTDCARYKKIGTPFFYINK